MPAIDALADRLSTYLGPDQVNLVRRAYFYAEQAHDGQRRRSGEAYVTHPLAVANILADMHMDHQSLMAAMLHDVIEDTGIPKEALVAQFGETVAELVDGVSKLTQMNFETKAEAQAENFQKMAMAMARDIRVILVKLADRLHNMRTLEVLAGEKRRRIAKETLEIYAPIANRLGMHTMRVEFEDLGFKAMHPMRSERIRAAVRRARGNRNEIVEKIEQSLIHCLERDGLEGEVLGREKHLYSIYKKMRGKRKAFHEIMDVYAFRIVVDKVDTCYRVLGAVHSLYKPLPGRFKDYIAIPKANGYQSLHTVLFGPYGSPIEVQIRTEEMDLIAERGIAAHWAYKHGGAPTSAQTRAHSWIANLLESQRATGSSLEFLENVKVDLFPDEVYLFTPKGDILSLPRNATALDFAYAVHTDVGNHAVAARVDRKLVPLRTKLVSGQQTEIITARSALPKPQWLEFVVTSKARTAIRQQLKQLEHEDAVQLGHRMLDRALEDLGSSLERVPQARLEAYLGESRHPRLEALLADIALGNRMPSQVAHALAQSGGQGGRDGARHFEKILITGSERGVITFANCCMPIPGDEIMGYHTAGKGIVVHRIECPNITDYRKSPERWVDIGWDREVSGDFSVALRIEVANRPGVLAQVAAAVAQVDSNIDGVEYLERDSNVAAIRFSIEVRGRKHLADVIRRIRRLNVVHGVQRL